MEQKVTNYSYLINPAENMSFNRLLIYLTQYTNPSDFYLKIQSIVKEEKNFFNSLPEADKTGETYKRRIGELEALTNMLLKVRDDATLQICTALDIDPPPTKSNNDQIESSLSESYSEGGLLGEYIYHNSSPEPQSYYPDDTNLYNLCVKIINKTETPVWHYFTNKNNLITKIENVIKDVGNQKITIFQHQNYMLKLANLQILDMKQSLFNPDEAEEKKIADLDLDKISKKQESKINIKDLVANSMIKPPNPKLSPKPQIKKNDDTDYNHTTPLTMIQSILNRCL